MLGAFMAVLDIQITNASLKDIQAALGATLEEGSWISTSYLGSRNCRDPADGLAVAGFFHATLSISECNSLRLLFRLLCLGMGFALNDCLSGMSGLYGWHPDSDGVYGAVDDATAE
jgi:DHA2 family multidrug resistance protein